MYVGETWTATARIIDVIRHCPPVADVWVEGIAAISGGWASHDAKDSFGHMYLQKISFSRGNSECPFRGIDIPAILTASDNEADPPVFRIYPNPEANFKYIEGKDAFPTCA